MVCKETTRCKEHGYLFPDEVKDGKCTRCQSEVTIGKSEKMSKSLKNVVDPDYLIKNYGADTVRMFCLFASPPEKDLEWSDQGVEGSFRFLNRAWRIVIDYLEDIKHVTPFDGSRDIDGDLKNLRRKTHQTMRKVTRDIEDRFHFNTAISAVMELVNALYLMERPARERYDSPFCHQGDHRNDHYTAGAYCSSHNRRALDGIRIRKQFGRCPLAFVR